MGAGAAGTLVAARLLDEANRRRRRLTVHLLDPRRAAGQGVAYSTTDHRHLLNVQARGMSAYAEDPHHFVRWLERHLGGEVDPCGFAPRALYARYLAEVLEEARHRTPWATLQRRNARVVGATRQRTGCVLSLDDGDELPVDAAVLALGCVGSSTAWAPEPLQASPRFVADPWAPGALRDVDPAADVLVVGTGLTMVDVFRSLDRRGRVVHAISRRGRLPARHVAGMPPRMEAPELPSRATLAQLREVMTRHVDKARERYGDWRPAVDSIRAITPTLWAQLSPEDQAEFLAGDVRTWETARHRMPPATATAIERARHSGRLAVRAASVVDAVDNGDGLTVTLSDGAELTVGAVVNCTGLAETVAGTENPLVRQLLDDGLVRPGPHGLGFDTAADGRLRDSVGDADGLLWTIGPLRRGSLWETTAMPEIRVQAATLAHELVGSATPSDPGPRDRYGLAVSTTSDAAGAWNRALDSLLLLHDGAEQALQEAVAADPGFALGHATLALVGHELGGTESQVDVTASLERACRAAAMRADAREQSFVHVVEARVLGPQPVADRALRRHLREFPLDALAVSIAVPTIASGGLDQPTEAAWALAEELAPSYGDDWWFTGVLAFLRQEQRHWDDAARLADRSLAGHPASGHAAHAQAHVHYETGEHTAGVAWLDDWIAAHGSRSRYRAHYAWHAALHELALDDAPALRRRYDAQLAPPTVTGARALVDSASLLWRAPLAGCWRGDVAIGEVLDTTPGCLVERPTTAFAALNAAVALAVAGDADRLVALQRYADGHEQATFRDVVAPLAAGLQAHVRGDFVAAARLLEPVVDQRHRLGGSAAQQEVVEDTLLDALVRSGRCADAIRILQARLDRRPHPNDARRLAQVSLPPGPR